MQLFNNSVIYIFSMFILNNILVLSQSKLYDDSTFPVIIWWTDLLYPHVGVESDIECNFGKCISYKKRLLSSEKKFVTYLFYGTDFSPEDLPLPRKNNHLWALLHEESPMNNYILSHIPGITLFNFTSTFSRYSDFPLTTQFIPSLEYFTDRKPVSITIKNKLRKEGIASILYLQSHCNVASDRDTYVQELMNYIKIDSYGVCLQNKKLPDHLSSTKTYNDEALFSFISNYKFHIAFENAICDDYITEKLYRPLHVGSVPIYMGSSTVKDWVPSNNSVINVNDFSSPAELAAFISVLDKNDELYNKYLDFKKMGVTNERLKQTLLNRTWGVNDVNKIDFIQSFECYLCDKIHFLNDTQSNVANIKHMNCPQPHEALFQVKSNKKWQQEEWVENYWFSYDKAKAIQQMIQNKDNNTYNFMKYIMAQKYKK